MTPPDPHQGAPRKADAIVVTCIDPPLTDDTTFLMSALSRTDRYSEMRIAALIEREGLEPRPAGLLRSTACFRRLSPVPPPA